MNRDKTLEVTSEDGKTDAKPGAQRLSAASDRDFQSDIDSEYMEPVNVYEQPPDAMKNNRHHNNTKSRTGSGHYATVCVAPRPPPTLPDPNANGIRRPRRVEGRRCHRICTGIRGIKRRKAWAAVKDFVQRRIAAFLCASLVMGTFGCIAFLVAVGVAASGTGVSTCCNCPAPDVTTAKAVAQTHVMQASNRNTSSLAAVGVPSGLPGPPGPPGPRGEKGGQGSPGRSGSPGIPGEKGEVGEEGKRGKRGVPGETGIGIKGDQGDVGPPGPVGVKGIAGQKGQQGQVGIRGAPGVQGVKGAKGDGGAIGPRGYTGYPGARGAEGAPGIQGVKGQKGRKGDLGQKGQRGEAL